MRGCRRPPTQPREATRMNSRVNVRMAGMVGGVLVALSGGGLAQAQRAIISAEADPRVESSFTIDFGDGQPSQSDIASTDFVLSLDADAGTARFVYYFQNIDPLTVFGADTGPITVEIIESQ